MRFKNKLMTTSLLVGTSVLATPAFAQSGQPAPAVTTQADPQVQADQAEPTAESEVVITGTLIRNPNLVASSPVNVVNEAEITLRAPNNAEELIRRIPGVTPGIGSQVNNGSNGINSVDLRGLGTQRNIVLLDGNRIVPTLANGATDLNVIPVALISRVDVLTGGASTTYGADAVSGVVNFITNRNFSGIDARAAYKLTERGDGQSHRVDLTIGGNFAEDRGNAVISFGYTKVEPVYQTRPFALFGISSRTGAASGSSATTTPTNINFGGTTGYQQLNPGGTAFVPYYEGFNFNPYNIFQTPLERKSAYGAATYEIADGIEFYARGLFSSNEISSIIAPSGIFGNPLVVNANNPYLTPALRDQICTFNGIALGTACTSRTGSTATTGLPLPAVYRRLVELGPRIGNYQNNVYDARVGTRFDVTSSSSLDLSLSYGKSEQNQTNSGYVLNSRVQQALLATSTTACTVTTASCVPLNLFGPTGSITPAQVAFIQGSANIAIDTQLQQARALYSGDLGFSAPWASNPVSFALGGEYRRYTYDRVPDARSQDPSELGGAGGAVLPFSGGYNVKEAYAELIAPIASDKPFFDELTLEAGVRYSDYKLTTGQGFDATTYKVGATWQPVDAIRLRGNYQRAVRAPNIGELFAPNVTGLTNLQVDPCALTNPVGNANLIATCLAQGAPAGQIGVIPNPVAGQANGTGGGNANLTPEKADTYTLGVVVTPKSILPGFSASLDYYNIDINSAITAPTPGDSLAACFNSPSPTSAACLAIRRNPVSGALSGPTGTVAGLPLYSTNQGRLRTNGFDFTANYDRDLGPVRLGLNLSGNYTRSLKFKATPTSYDRECAGYFSANCGPSLGQVQPKWSWTQRTSLGFGAATLSLLWRHIGEVNYEGTAADFLQRGFSGTNCAATGNPGNSCSRYLFRGAVTNQAPAKSALAGKTYDFNTIKAFDYFDLNAQFDIERRFQLTLGVLNLFDK
ncbi:TonB-dependent receptor plug domain-containing protein [Sphingomonas humi]|uniref:TonB-dependent receptor n=1 Tax=Sphingomonas humi TaxID=335630 RepID=A0ABP7RHN8_9SPHN